MHARTGSHFGGGWKENYELYLLHVNLKPVAAQLFFEGGLQRERRPRIQGSPAPVVPAICNTAKRAPTNLLAYPLALLAPILLHTLTKLLAKDSTISLPRGLAFQFLTALCKRKE